MGREFLLSSLLGVTLLSAPLDIVGQAPRQDAGPWKWDGQPHRSHAVVGMFDAKSGRIRHVYSVDAGDSCRNASEDEFSDRGTQFINGVGFTKVLGSPTWEPEIRRSGNLVTVSAHLGDFSATAYYYHDGGLLFAASTIWGGSGAIFWPADPLPQWAWSVLEGKADSPTFLDTSTEVPQTIIDTFRRLSPVHSLAEKPYSLYGISYHRDMQAWQNDNLWIVVGVRDGECPRPSEVPLHP